MSKIEWTEATWNPVTGCSKVSPGCAHCYAEAQTQRYAGAKGWPAEFKPWTPENAAENVVLHPERLDVPLRRKKPTMWFVNSMSDLFHELVPFEFIAQVWDTMFDTSGLAGTQTHTYQILTKRPERMQAFSRWMNDHEHRRIDYPNVWLGTSIENQQFHERAAWLYHTPAAVRFISAEPLLGPLKVSLSGIDWLIVGGESGPKARPMDLAWARSLRDQCRDTGTAFFMKQLGGFRSGNTLEELPEDLRIREYPKEGNRE